MAAVHDLLLANIAHKSLEQIHHRYLYINGTSLCLSYYTVFRYRLVVEESHSFGVLGKTGKGAVEHWGLQPEQVRHTLCITELLQSNASLCGSSVMLYLIDCLVKL